ncbi:ABC transporter ATP-binding protein [Streptomyces zinciresistens K42]|uniref:ABC transporter ATP-binding protein n=1 Tax=Streptomyces zinciresistens K42 TaxID=700597 RepID=G2GCT2_9ACTN|nr:ABC transporter ATP-binding protein [Streptomyces zinciresistens K42]
MRHGRLVESRPADEVHDDPRDPYTRRLLATVPALDPRVAARRGAERAQLSAVGPSDEDRPRTAAEPVHQ